MAADDGARSPLTFVFFLPMVYAAVFYPLRLFVPVGAADMVAFVVVADLYGHPEPTYVAFIAACLAFSAVLCAWQAQNHDRHRERLTLMSRTDPLTGCLNRRGFEERVTAELDAATRSGRSLALVLFDLDNFKAVNDMNGHVAGDELLCWVVEGLHRAVRPMDSVGRLGGDEFAILAPGRRRERRGADRDPRPQAAVGAGRGVDRDGRIPRARRSTTTSFSVTPTASCTRTSTATRPTSPPAAAS